MIDAVCADGIRHALAADGYVVALDVGPFVVAPIYRGFLVCVYKRSDVGIGCAIRIINSKSCSIIGFHPSLMDIVLDCRLSVLTLDASHVGKSVMVLGVLLARACVSPQVASYYVALVLLASCGQMVNAIKRAFDGYACAVLAIRTIRQDRDAESGKRIATALILCLDRDRGKRVETHAKVG